MNFHNWIFLSLASHLPRRHIASYFLPKPRVLSQRLCYVSQLMKEELLYVYGQYRHRSAAAGLVVNAMFTLPDQQESQISSVLPAGEPQMPMSDLYSHPGLCPVQKTSVHVYLCLYCMSKNAHKNRFIWPINAYEKPTCFQIAGLNQRCL